MSIKDRVIDELTRLDIMSYTRIPYTHHHDYVRENADNAVARVDVAKLGASEDELYACAFLQAVEGLSSAQKIMFDINKALYYQCLSNAAEHLNKLSSLFKEVTE